MWLLLAVALLLLGQPIIAQPDANATTATPSTSLSDELGPYTGALIFQIC